MKASALFVSWAVLLATDATASYSHPQHLRRRQAAIEWPPEEVTASASSSITILVVTGNTPFPEDENDTGMIEGGMDGMASNSSVSLALEEDTVHALNRTTIVEGDVEEEANDLTLGGDQVDNEEADIVLEATEETIEVSRDTEDECVPFILDFDADSDGNPTNAGDLAANLLWDHGITIRSGDPSLPPMLFDSANPTGGDLDLATVNQGIVLILSEDGDALDPDDNASGGTFVFDLGEARTISAVGLLDVEEAYELRFYDGAGDILRTVTRPPTPTGNNQLKREDFVDEGVVRDVTRVEIQQFGSGAVTYLEFACPEAAVEELAEETPVEISKTATTLFDGN